MSSVAFGAVMLGVGLLTASGALRACTQWPVALPFGWFVCFGIPGGLGFTFLGVYGLSHIPLAGWAGLVMLVVAILGILLTPRPFAKRWASGLLGARSQRSDR